MVMKNGLRALRPDEKVLLSLRGLYGQYGYRKYKMSKFEEYDLYAENKRFLRSENILTFNDTNGKLLALKPDVTLSIIKNFKENSGAPEKVYYNENVYRFSESAHEFKEIMQAGLEYIGDIDLYAMGEVITLALKSLSVISNTFILDIAHLGLAAGLLSAFPLSVGAKEELSALIGAKNTHGIRKLCDDHGLPAEARERLIALTSIYAPFAEAIEQAKALNINEKTDTAIRELENLYRVLAPSGLADHIRLDFSIINDLDYYNGVIFQGFIEQAPAAVLSGGRYDNLLGRLGKHAGAIGFAVYLDLLERYSGENAADEADILLLYDAETDPAVLSEVVCRMTAEGKTVLVEKAGAMPALPCRAVYQMKNGEAVSLEKNA